MIKASYTRFLLALPVVVLVGYLSSPSTAFAACDAQCVANKQANEAIWETRQPFDVNGKRYYAAVAPDRSYVLVGWKKGTKTTSLAELERVGSSASGCVAQDSSVLSSLSGNPATQIATKVFKTFKYLRLDLSC